jgi:hypothetical protein
VSINNSKTVISNSIKIHSTVLGLLHTDGRTYKEKLIVSATLDANSRNNDSSCDFSYHLAVYIKFLRNAHAFSWQFQKRIQFLPTIKLTASTLQSSVSYLSYRNIAFCFMIHEARNDILLTTLCITERSSCHSPELWRINDDTNTVNERKSKLKWRPYFQNINTGTWGIVQSRITAQLLNSRTGFENRIFGCMTEED